MRRSFFVLPILLALISCEADPSIPIAPKVELDGNGVLLSEVKSTSVTLHGKFPDYYRDKDKVSEIGFVISTEISNLNDPDRSINKIVEEVLPQSVSDYSFSAEVTSLTPNTIYYFLAYISNGFLREESQISSFHTRGWVVFGLSLNDNILRARIDNIEGEEIPQGTQLGFCWSREESLLSVEGKVLGKYDPATQTFSAELPDLEANTPYYFWAFSDTLDGEGGGSLTYSDPLKVAGPRDVTLYSNISSFEAEPEGGSFSVVLEHNSKYSVTITADWIIQVLTRANSQDRLEFYVLPNQSSMQRTGEIVFVSEDGNVKQTLEVTQEPRMTFNVSVNTVSVGQKGGAIDISVDHNVDYIIDISEDWISQVLTRSEDALTFYIEENPYTDKRVATITFCSVDGSVIQTVTVIQDEAEVFINIPDPAFKAYCLKEFDQNHDGEISTKEALAVTYISVNTMDICSLEGIEYFENLSHLFCSIHWKVVTLSSSGWQFYDEDGNTVEGNLRTLDLSNNLKLEHLDCGGNQLDFLDVGQNTALKRLYCDYNHLSSLDVTNNGALEELYCLCNHLSYLDVSNNGALKELRCGWNQLSSLDVNNNGALVELNCGGNQLEILNVSKNIAIHYLECCDNQLSSMDVSKNSALEEFHCRGNQKLTEIWLKEGQAIEIFDFDSDISTIYYK